MNKEDKVREMDTLLKEMNIEVLTKNFSKSTRSMDRGFVLETSKQVEEFILRTRKLSGTNHLARKYLTYLTLDDLTELALKANSLIKL